MHALIYQNFIQIFVEIPDMKAPRKPHTTTKIKLKDIKIFITHIHLIFF
jgi:hypothetical protein